MSRTDRDRPYRVRSADSLEPREAHHEHVVHWAHNRHAGLPRGAELECDLPDYHDRHPEPPRAWAVGKNTVCYWRLAYWVYSPYRGVGGVPKWYRDHTWNNPERVRVRAHNVEWRKVANAGGDLDDWDMACYPNHREGGWYD